MLILSTVVSCSPPADFETVSAHLEAIREADQSDRRNRVEGVVMVANDRERRAAVEAYLDADCLQTGRDHHNAALVFQHGGDLEHYRRAWALSVRAVELGDAEAAWLIPRAIDRYFMFAGYRQLYATNYQGESLDPEAGADGGFIWCMWPVADSVTEADREALGVNTLAQQMARIAELNDADEGRFCETDAEDPPTGEFPGYW
jgi:hypothetical protein